jgi:hypothetical protein
VPDLDQRRFPDSAGKGGLPNGGKFYCIPTVSMDWLVYLAGKGYMVAPPVKNWLASANFNEMSSYIKLLGGMMETDPSSGTDQDGLESGLGSWFYLFEKGKTLGSPYVLKVFRVGERFDPSPGGMAVAAINGALVIVHVGYYAAAPVIGFYRTGGHALALVQASGKLFASSATIGVSNPEDKSDNDHVQSGYQTDFLTLEKKTVQVGLFPTVPLMYWSLNGLPTTKDAHYDGYTTIEPEVVFTDPDDAIVLDQPGNFNRPRGRRQPPRAFKISNGPVVDLAVAPEGFVHPYLRQGSDTIWQLDTVTGQTSRLAEGPEGASRLMFGGRVPTLFVIGRNELVAFDRAGNRLHSAPLRDSLDAIAYDDRARRLVALSLSARRLFFFSEGLRPRGSRALSSTVLAGDGGPAVAVTRGGTVLVHRDGESSVAAVPTRGTARPRVIALRGVRNPQGMTVDDRGHMFVAENGRLVDFLPNGARIARSPFNGMPAERFVHVSRSWTNLSPRTVLDHCCRR